MTVKITNAPVLVAPSGSHWLELENGPRRGNEVFSREELHPILELDVPRVGKVRARFEANRYVASDATLGAVWTDWRVFLRDVRTPDPERPDLPHLGRLAGGIGDATRKAIGDACEPLIREWLDGDGYKSSRQTAAAYALRREIDPPPDYRLSRARTLLELLDRELAPGEAALLGAGLSLLEQACETFAGEAMPV